MGTHYFCPFRSPTLAAFCEVDVGCDVGMRHESLLSALPGAGKSKEHGIGAEVRKVLNYTAKDFQTYTNEGRFTMWFLT